MTIGYGTGKIFVEKLGSTSLSRSTLYEAMSRGNLAFVKHYGRRLVLHADLIAFLSSLARTVSQ